MYDIQVKQIYTHSYCSDTQVIFSNSASGDSSYIDHRDQNRDKIVEINMKTWL